MSNHLKGFAKFKYDFKKFYPLLLNLASRDIKLKYRRSVLGILWSVLNPLLTMLVLTTVFGILLRISMDNFSTYYIVGYSVWAFFSEATSISMSSIIGSAALIKKVYIPKYVFPLEKCLFALINFAFSLIAVIIVMIVEGVYPTFWTLLAPLPVLYCFVFCVGFSLILSALTVYFRDIMHLYSVLLTVWMYLTPIIYPMSLLEEATGKYRFVITVVKLNPMYHYVDTFRCLFMHGSNPEVYPIPPLNEHLICIAISVITLAIGALVFRKAEKKFILHI